MIAARPRLFLARRSTPFAARAARWPALRVATVSGEPLWDPEALAAVGAKLADELAVSVVDINFGCPVKKVLGRCRGGFHLSQPAVALEIVARVREAAPPEVPVTVKMRRGIDDDQQQQPAQPPAS